MGKIDEYNTRATLLDRIRDDDENAWNEFCDFYWDLIHGWARRMGCTEHQAQDVFQETILNLLKQMKGFDYDPQKGCFRAFLKTIVRCRVSDSFRKDGRYVNASAFETDENKEFDLLDQYDHVEQPETLADDVVWLDSILRQALRNAYSRIDEQSYKSFCLYVLDQRPVEEVMKELGIERQGAIYQQKSRFLNILKKEFNALLTEMGSSPESEQMHDVDDRIFSQAVARLVEGRCDLRNTLSETATPPHIKEKFHFIKQHIPSTGMPEASGDYLLVIPLDGLSKWQKTGKNLTIGRSDSSGLQLEANGVSGLHASISIDSGSPLLKDENSTNGTFLNGKKISKPEILKNGDLIQISSGFTLVYCLV